jgi:hypothetical protein
MPKSQKRGKSDSLQKCECYAKMPQKKSHRSAKENQQN